MQSITLSIADNKKQVAANVDFPVHAVITNAEQLKNAVQFDHVAGSFENSKRVAKNFISADCIIMDCDNDATDFQEAWLTPKALAERLQDVPFYAVYSRNHMRVKHADDEKTRKSARPRFHVYFPLNETCTDGKAIRALKEELLEIVPEFDAGAKDVSRQFFGVENPVCETFEGSVFIDAFIFENMPFAEAGKSTINEDFTDNYQGDVTIISTDNTANTKAGKKQDNEAIHEGSRHTEMFNYAMHVLGTFGREKARRMFIEKSTHCVPPLLMSELNQIWRSADNYAKDFKNKFSQRKNDLTLPALEKTLQSCNISVRLNCISHLVAISDLPLDSEFVPDSYKNASQFARAEGNAHYLTLFLHSYLKSGGYAFTYTFLCDALNALAITNQFNPFLDMLRSTMWDGKDRIDALCNVLGINSKESTEFGYYRCYLKKWLWQVVSMALNDDGMLANEFVLCLQGGQGIGKTSFFRKLAVYPQWFLEGASIDVRNKDSIMESTQVLICELGELDATLSREQSSLKAFLTRRNDTYRAPFGHHAVQYARRTSFAATVNPEQFLRDPTGSRRFVVIPVKQMDLDFIHNGLTQDFMAQLWKQVYIEFYLERGRTGFFLTPDERAFSEERNAQFNVMVDGEFELFDRLDWTQPVEAWQWYTNTDIIEKLGLWRKISATKMGRALTSVMAKDKRVRKQRTMNINRYLLPPKKFYEL